jgi:hypothetical protein
MASIAELELAFEVSTSLGTLFFAASLPPPLLPRGRDVEAHVLER